jgi:hypothetical protein
MDYNFRDFYSEENDVNVVEDSDSSPYCPFENGNPLMKMVLLGSRIVDEVINFNGSKAETSKERGERILKKYGWDYN